MRDNQKLIEDLITLGGNLFGNVLSARNEIRAQAQQRGEQLSRMLGLVGREEFDAAFTMLGKARLMQDELNARLALIEKRLNIPPVRTAKNPRPAAASATMAKKPRSGVKANLPSVKKDKRKD